MKRGWRALRPGARWLGFLVALVGCSGRAEPAVDMMAADADHRPGPAPVARPREPVALPEEPEPPGNVPP